MIESDDRIVPGERRMERMTYAEKGRFFKIRQVLNTIFILLTIVGIALFFFGQRTVGGGVLIACVFIKLMECVLRIIK